MRYNDVVRCEKTATHYDEFLVRTDVREADYHSFIEYPYPGNLGKPRERLVVYSLHYKEESIEFYEVDEAGYPEVIEYLNGTIVENLVPDPDYHNGRESARRTVVQNSSGKRTGVIINPPVPFAGHPHKSGSTKYLAILAGLAAGLAFWPVLKAMKRRKIRAR